MCDFSFQIVKPIFRAKQIKKNIVKCQMGIWSISNFLPIYPPWLSNDILHDMFGLKLYSKMYNIYKLHTSCKLHQIDIDTSFFILFLTKSVSIHWKQWFKKTIRAICSLMWHWIERLARNTWSIKPSNSPGFFLKA